MRMQPLPFDTNLGPSMFRHFVLASNFIQFLIFANTAIRLKLTHNCVFWHGRCPWIDTSFTTFAIILTAEWYQMYFVHELQNFYRTASQYSYTVLRKSDFFYINVQCCENSSRTRGPSGTISPFYWTQGWGFTCYVLGTDVRLLSLTPTRHILSKVLKKPYLFVYNSKELTLHLSISVYICTVAWA